VHYSLDVPPDVKGPIEITVRLRYRKFDFEYMSIVYGGDNKVPKLPVVDVCTDKVTLPVEGGAANVPEQKSPIEPAWQRWNDYGIGCFLEGGAGEKKGQLRQAEEAFKKLLTHEKDDVKAHGFVNLARVYIDEGRLDEARQMLTKAKEAGAPWWLTRWFGGLVNARNVQLEDAQRDFEEDPKKQPRDPDTGVQKYDFTKDYIVINELGITLYRRAQTAEGPERDDLLRQAVRRFQDTLAIDPENLDAHNRLRECLERLGENAFPEEAKAVAVDDYQLLPLAETFANAKATKADRRQAAWQLAQAIKAVGERPVNPQTPKVPALTPLVPLCTKVYRDDPEAEMRTTAAFVLGHLHRELHLIYKPDDNARNSTVQKYRAKHPAANAAAEAIVIYPTEPDEPKGQHRPGFGQDSARK
jgi:tetratricopeptide (TPR) repeat protein